MVDSASPLVSVVVPAFNQAQYLAKAIASALAQDYRNLEIIVIDDGSTDCTPDVARQFGSAIHYYHQENRGLPAARNAAIRLARGKYIALLDADDFWDTDYLSLVVRKLEADCALGAVHTGFKCVDEEGRPLPQSCTVTVPDHAMYERLIDGEFFAPSSVLVRGECFERVGLFDETLLASEDWDMWLRVSKAYRFAGIPRPLLNYRVHGDNMSANPDRMLKYQMMVVAKHYGPAEGPYASWPTDRRRSCAAVYRYAAQGYLSHGDLERGRWYLRAAFEAFPPVTQSMDLYWELGCVDQPLGRRGDFANLNLETNAVRLLSIMDDIFARQDLPPEVRSRRRTAFARAYLALGMLSYGSGRLGLARGYLRRALVSDPCLAAHPQLVPSLGKSLLGRRLVGTLKLAKARLRMAQPFSPS